MKVTIKDIAKECNMSVTSVSLVLNGKPNRLSEESRAQIKSVAARLKYTPNHLAVGLVKGKTRTIGLLMSDVSNIFLAEIAKVIEREVKRFDYTVILGNTDDDGSRALSYVKEFVSKKVDGIFYVHPSRATIEEEREIANVITQSDIPIVMIENDMRFMRAQRCVNENDLGGYLATKYLLDLGHKRIGSLLGPKGQNSVGMRLYGYRKALEEYGITYDEKLIYRGDFTLESGIKAAPYFLEQGVTAIFCYNDMMAYGIYTYAQRNKIQIGRDLSVVGFDDAFVNELLSVPLTTVRQPRTAMAKRAIGMLLDMIETGDREEKVEFFKPKLIVRDSANPPLQ